MIEEIDPILPGWVNYFAVGHSSRCFSFIKLWVEKKIRRHLLRARGVGKEPDGMSLSGIGLIALHMKQAGKPSAGKQHAGFDAAGAGNQLTFRILRHSQRNGEPQLGQTYGVWRQSSTPLLKPHVAKLVVCNPRKNALLKDGNKSDRIDARKLAELLRGGYLRSVYHGERPTNLEGAGPQLRELED